jgi:hypothetical protein
MIGVYAIVHTPTRRLYVGSSVNIEKRFIEHRADLSQGAHHCAHLQNAWNKYGSDQFEFVIGGMAENGQEARELEQAFLDCYFGDCLFNSKNSAIGFGFGDASPARRPDWHMKTVKLRLTPEERQKKYGHRKGKKVDGRPYVVGAAKRLSNPDYRKTLSEACKGKRASVECPHCGLRGGGGNMRRYHFDKCKNKP